MEMVKAGREEGLESGQGSRVTRYLHVLILRFLLESIWKS